MRRVRYECDGAFAVTSAEAPTPGPGQLLLRVDAVGVTRPVVRALAGDASAALAGEVAGEVVAVGDGVTDWMPGYRVIGSCVAEAYAEYALIDAVSATTIPDGASAVDAVALIGGGLVALGAIDAARPQSGESVLVTAAAGGVGHLAVQLARVRGAKRVIAAVADHGKSAFLDDLGVDETVTYTDATWGEGVDIALDALGGDLLTPVLATLAPGGRLVAYGADGIVRTDDLLAANAAVIGFRLARVAPETTEQWRQELWQYFATGEVRPAVHAEFALADAARAHDEIARRANLGKVVLVP